MIVYLELNNSLKLRFMYNNADLLTFVARYWSQLTLFLIGIGYLIKIILDHNSKRKEIRHKIFQERKLDSIADFVNSCTNMLDAINGIKVEEVFFVNYTDAIGVLNKELKDKLNCLNRSTNLVRLYLDDESYKTFGEVSELILSINKYLTNLCLLDKSNGDIKMEKFAIKISEDGKSVLNKLNSALTVIRKKY